MRRVIPRVVLVLLVASAIGPASCAAAPQQQPAPADLQKQIDALRAQVGAMQKDLDEIKALLAPLKAQVPSTPENVTLDLGSRPVRGSQSARLVMVEFTDYQWTYCLRYVRETYPQIDTTYIQTGKLKYAIFDLPLESIHSQAFRAATASRCASEQGRYWEMRARLFANPQTLDQVEAHAAAVGVGLPQFEKCMAAGRFAEQIRRDMSQAEAAGVSGTPSFMLGTIDTRGQVKVERMIRGAQPLANFKSEIDALLARQ